MSDQVAVNYLHLFLERHPVRTFKKGEVIIFQGEVPRTAFVIKSGTVKVYNLSVGGDEKPVTFYSADNTFPASWVYGKAANALYYYEAFTPEVREIARAVSIWRPLAKSQDALAKDGLSNLRAAFGNL